jgi:hypothetical protein
MAEAMSRAGATCVAASMSMCCGKHRDIIDGMAAGYDFERAGIFATTPAARTESARAEAGDCRIGTANGARTGWHWIGVKLALVMAIR